jgi:DNA-binding transcriptional LysR family regulator
LESLAGSGGGDAAAAVHHFGFELGFKGLNLTEHGEAAGRAAHLVLELVEHFMQALSGGPEGGVVLSRCGVHVHGGSVGFLDNMIGFACDLG